MAVALSLYGRDPAALTRVVDRTLADPEAVPLLGVAGASERAYATAVTIAREEAIARCVESQVTRCNAAATSVADARAAMARAEEQLGHVMTAGQRDAVEEHPEALRRLDRLDQQIAVAAWELDVERQGLDGIRPERPHPLSRGMRAIQGLDRGLDLGIDL